MRDRDRPDAPTGSVSDRPVQRRAGAGLTVGRLGELPRPPLVDAPVERRASPTVGPTSSTTTPLDDPFFYCPTLGGDVVQARGDLGPDADRVRAEAAAGVAGPGQALPHGDAIARSFGPAHELSSVRAHVGGAAATAAAAIGATAYATGADVAFAAPPDLHTAAHEAAHVVQQRAGVHLAGGVGAAGDPYERHADAVADRVVAGESAADLLSPTGGAATTGAAVQRAPRPGGARDAEARAATKVELTGLASVYRLYQRYRETHGLEIAYAANTISDGSELLRDTTQSDALSRQLEAALPAYGFATIRDFEAKIAQYERDFEAGAAEVVFALLDRYTAQLSAEAARLRDPGAVRALHGQLGGFRGHQQAQEEAVGDHQRVVMSMQFGWGATKPTGDDVARAGQRVVDEGAGAERALGDLGAANPVLRDDGLPADKRLDRSALARATPEQLGPLLHGHLAERLADLAQARGRIAGDRRVVYQLDQLFPQFYAALGVAPGSIFDLIIADKRRQLASDKLIDAVLLAVLALALSVVSLGTATPALAAAATPRRVATSRRRGSNLSANRREYLEGGQGRERDPPQAGSNLSPSTGPGRVATSRRAPRRSLGLVEVAVVAAEDEGAAVGEGDGGVVPARGEAGGGGPCIGGGIEDDGGQVGVAAGDEHATVGEEGGGVVEAAPRGARGRGPGVTAGIVEISGGGVEAGAADDEDPAVGESDRAMVLARRGHGRDGDGGAGVEVEDLGLGVVAGGAEAAAHQDPTAVEGGRGGAARRRTARRALAPGVIARLVDPALRHADDDHATVGEHHEAAVLGDGARAPRGPGRELEPLEGYRFAAGRHQDVTAGQRHGVRERMTTEERSDHVARLSARRTALHGQQRTVTAATPDDERVACELDRSVGRARRPRGGPTVPEAAVEHCAVVEVHDLSAAVAATRGDRQRHEEHQREGSPPSHAAGRRSPTRTHQR
jgi:hypothetical protein